METDYTNLTENDFIKTIKDYVGFLFLNNYIQLATNSISSNQDISLETANWQYFYISDIFGILEKAKCSNASVLLTSGEDVFYIGAKKTNNGVMEKVVTVDNLISKGNSIVFIGDGQGSIGYTSYQPFDFIDSTTLTLGYNQKLNKYNAMFLVTVLDLERYRYSFGRKYGKNIIMD
ncbi:restriction endonuclease subunit S [Candidatus Tisiphia endosymbiont of Empis tessellata]|uniref:restriction endonuclease subunit S n=1 Tax=Candidatus Tisiphia endosymbiont of Empis tessellata TaxID=3066259 RepID=UPI00313F1AEC